MNEIKYLKKIIDLLKNENKSLKDKIKSLEKENKQLKLMVKKPVNQIIEEISF